MESTSHEERQHGWIGDQFVAVATHEIEFLREQQLRDVELHVVSEFVERASR